MALYQPTNITPSTFAGIGGGVVDVNDNVSISWQVNGNSAMTGFSIVISTNDVSSTEVHTFTVSGLNFYGTDANGNPVFYVYEPETSWYAAGLRNGNSYKMKITQTFGTSSSVVQNSDSVFITRKKPTLSILPSAVELTSVSQDFTASYAQDEGDSVSWVRWVLTDTSTGTIIEDTGTLYTGLLAYSYNGFFSGKTYSLSCTVETSSGVTKTVTNTYAVSYSTPEQTGGITAMCNTDDSVTLSWTGGRYVPGIPDADEYGEFLDGVLHLAASRSITWDEVNGGDMSFAAPYCFAWRGKIAQSTTTDPVTVNSGTWVTDETSTVTGSTNRSTVVTSNMWSLNPSAPSTATTTETNIAIPVTTSQSSSTGEWVSTKTKMSAAGSWLKNGRYYTYRTGTPATISLSQSITSYYAGQAVYFDSNSSAVAGSLADAYIEITRTSSSSLSIVIYTNNSESYNRDAMASVTCTIASTYKGSITRAPASGDTNISNPQITWHSDELTDVSIVWNGTNFVISGIALSSGTYYVSYRYTRAYRGNDKYRAQFEGVLNVAGATLTGVTITSPGGTSAYGNPNKGIDGSTKTNYYTITVYNSSSGSNVTCSYTLVYSTKSTASYKSTTTGNYLEIDPYAITAPYAVSVVSTTAQGGATATIDENGNYTVTMRNPTAVSCTATIVFEIKQFLTINNVATLTDGTNELTVSSSETFGFTFYLNSNIVASFNHPADAWFAVLGIDTEGTITALYFNRSETFLQRKTDIFSDTVPAPLSSVVIGGEQECDFVYVTRNTDFLKDNDYTPHWNEDTLLFADFNGDLQGGSTNAVSEEVSYTGSAGYVNYPAGTVSDSSSTYKKTDFIDVGHYNYLSYKRLKSTSVLNMGMCFYDSAQNPISNSGARVLIRQDANGYADDTVPVPAGAKYARFTYYAADTYGEFAVSGVIVTAKAAIYRNDGETLVYVGTFEEGVASIRDYGIRSGRQYVYDMYYDLAGEYTSGAESAPICRQFRQHTLIEAEEDERLANVYHPVNVWRFRDNLNAGSYTNQNQPVLLENFTAYPLWQPHSAHAKSGTLTALIGRFVNGVYSGDTAADMDRLFDLSTSVNPLFYRDMKGNLYMVRLSGPITQTINNQTGVLEVSVSVPWVEVGDASDVKIYTEG